MNYSRTLIVAILLGCIPLSVMARQSAPQGQKQKIGFINSAVLQEQIGEYKARMDTLNKQFEPRVAEVQGLNNRINGLENTIRTQGSGLTPTKIAEMTEQLERMKREQKRKSEDLQSEADRAKEQLLTPFKTKLQSFLQEYTTKRGISMLIDLANAFESNTVIWFDPRADVTADFVAEFNKANPVGGAPAPKP